MWQKVKKFRWFLGIFLAIALLLMGVQIDLNKDTGKAVITIGNAYAIGVADYTCDGVADDVQFQQAMNALPAGGGKLIVKAGSYAFTATVLRAINNVSIEGEGFATAFANNGALPLFSAGVQTGWVFRDLATDAGGITQAADTVLGNVKIGATVYNKQGNLFLSGNMTAASISAPTGRGATFYISCSDATAIEKNQADLLLTGTNDGATINAIITPNKSYVLSSGTVILGNSSINLADGDSLVGQGVGRTVIKNTAYTNGILSTDLNNIYISNLELNGNKATYIDLHDAHNNSGIMLTKGYNNTIDHVYSHDYYGYAFHLDAFQYSSITNCRGTTSMYSLHAGHRTLPASNADAGYKSYFANNTFEDTAATFCGSYNMFVNNQILNTTLSVYGVYQDVEGNVILNSTDASIAHENTIQNGDANGCGYSKFINNVMINTTGGKGGFQCGVSADTVTVTGDIIQGNNIYPYAGYGAIVVYKLVSSTISDNNVSSSGANIDTVQVRAGCTKNVIDNNQILGAGRHGINIRDVATYNSLTNNYITGSATDGINIGNQANNYNFISNNKIYANSNRGITMSDTPTQNKILNNDLSSNVNGGVFITDTGMNNNPDIYDNRGFISKGEIRTYSGTIATLTENAYNSVDNPFGQTVRVLSLNINVSTGATATTPNIDCGIGNSATTDYTTLFDDLPGETVGYYTSTIAVPGTQTVPQTWASGGGNRYLNMSIKDAAATGMIATYTVTVMGN